MCAGADSIDDVDVVRCGGMKALFGGVYAPSTIGTLLREFTFGHARQLESVLREHLAGLGERVDLLPGADVRAFVDIDSLLRPVYGHAKQGAGYGHTKIVGKQVLRKGLSPLATTISTDTAAPMIAGLRLRAGRTGSGKGAGRMVAQAIATARAAGVTGQILVRGDSAYGTRAVVSACRRARAQFSLVLTKDTKVQAAINAIAADAWIPVRYPGAMADPDTGAWISDAEVAEIPYTAFSSTDDPVTARLVVRRVKDAKQAGRAVSGLALSPLLHQLRPAHHRGRPHPPPPRDRGDHLRRPDRRPAGPYPGSVRRQLRLGAMRRDNPQPATRRRNPRRRPPRQSPRGNTAPHTGQRLRPDGPATTPACPTPTHPLALGPRMASIVAQHHRTLPATAHYILTTPTGEHRKSWVNQRLPCAHTRNQDQNRTRRGVDNPSVDRGLERALQYDVSVVHGNHLHRRDLIDRNSGAPAG